MERNGDGAKTGCLRRAGFLKVKGDGLLEFRQGPLKPWKLDAKVDGR